MSYSFGKKLKELRGKSFTQEGLAKALNLKYGTKFNKGMISKWENDKEDPRMDSIRYLADFFDTTLDELLGLKPGDIAREETAVYEVVNNDHSNIVNIPIVGTITAGEPILAVENIEGYIPILNAFISKDKEYFYLKVQGNSMDLEFKEGSFILVECTNSVENGQIAVVLVNGCDATVKKVSLGTGSITLIPLSTDPSHQPKSYNINKDEVRIIGKVIQATKLY